MTLVVDVGTNAEIVLGQPRPAAGRAAARPARPSRAPRSAPASEPRPVPSSGCASTATTLEPRFRVIGVDAWSDDPGFAEAVAAAGTGVTGICGSGIIEVVAELYLAGVDHRRRRHRRRARRAHAAGRAGRPDVQLRPPRAGRRRPAHRRHPERRARHPARQGRPVRRRPAAHGPARASTPSTRSGWPARSAARSTRSTRWSSGSSPTATSSRVRAAGNAAGTGALIALLSGAARREIEGVVRRVEKIETAVEPRFQEHFVEAMAIPHRTAPNPQPRAGRHAAAPAGRPPIGAQTAPPGAAAAGRAVPERDRRRPMTGSVPTRRSGGREGRRAARLQRTRSSARRS